MGGYADLEQECRLNLVDGLKYGYGTGIPIMIDEREEEIERKERQCEMGMYGSERVAELSSRADAVTQFLRVSEAND
jgi:hypothetical protein